MNCQHLRAGPGQREILRVLCISLHSFFLILLHPNHNRPSAFQNPTHPEYNMPHATATFNGKVIAEADSWESVEGNIYFPPSTVDQSVLSKATLTTVCPWKGTASYYNVNVDGESVPHAVDIGLSQIARYRGQRCCLVLSQSEDRPSSEAQGSRRFL